MIKRAVIKIMGLFHVASQLIPAHPQYPARILVAFIWTCSCIFCLLNYTYPRQVARRIHGQTWLDKSIKLAIVISSAHSLILVYIYCPNNKKV